MSDFATMTASPMMERLLTLLKEQADLIRRAEEDAYQASKEIEALEREMKQVQFRYEFEVLNEKNGEGKAVFSNEKSRDSEVGRRLSQDNEYRELQDKHRAQSDIQFKAKQTSWTVKTLHGDIKTELNARTAYMISMSDPVCRKEMLEYAARFANQTA